MITPQLTDESIEELRGILNDDSDLNVSFVAAKKIGEFLVRLYSHLAN